MRLKHLTLKNWMNFKDVSFEIQGRLFIVGPNASGKSNLLDSLRFLQQIASDGGGFQSAVEIRGGVENLRCLATRNYNHGRVMVGIVLEDKDKVRWTYELMFTSEGKDRRHPLLVSEKVWKNKRQLLDRPTEADKSDPKRMTQTFLERATWNQRFRPVAEFLESVQYLHLVPRLVRGPQAVRGNGDGVGIGDDPYGTDFLVRIARTPASERQKRLEKISAALRVAVPQFDSLKLVEDLRGKWHLQARYKHWHSRSAQQDERDFSDGTLRLIALLWSLMELEDRGGRMLLLEEPELSLHTSIIWQLPGVFSRTRRSDRVQVLVTTHSDDVFRDEGIGLDEVLMLRPGREGTEAVVAASVRGVQEGIEAGLFLPEVLKAHTRPPEAEDFAREASRA